MDTMLVLLNWKLMDDNLVALLASRTKGEFSVSGGSHWWVSQDSRADEEPAPKAPTDIDFSAWGMDHSIADVAVRKHMHMYSLKLLLLSCKL